MPLADAQSPGEVVHPQGAAQRTGETPADDPVLREHRDEEGEDPDQVGCVAQRDLALGQPRNPLLAASSATPAPVIPPPTTSTSNCSAARRASATARSKGGGRRGVSIRPRLPPGRATGPARSPDATNLWHCECSNRRVARGERADTAVHHN